MLKQYDSDVTLEALKKITRGSESACRENCFALLEAARNKDSFLNHVKTISSQSGGRVLGDEDYPELEKMSEPEFANLNWTVGGERLWNRLKYVSPIEACRGGLWLYITLMAIEREYIEPSYLASGGNRSGSDYIDASLNFEEGSRGVPLYLEVSRKILRTSFGAITERGEKAVFTDIPFAKIWWQRHLAEEIAKDIDFEPEDILSYFEQNSTIWELLTAKMASKLTVVADQPVRDGIVCFLITQFQSSNRLTKDDLDSLLRRLGYLLAWRALGSLEINENFMIIKELVKS